MASLTNCEFMIRGYHYTKPTSPSRTDSCRLHIDTNVSGETSSVNTTSKKWTSPTTATVDTSTWGSKKRLKLKGFHNFYAKN